MFLAGAECPFTCLFCDLWRHTIDGPTPAGAIPAQLATALHAAGERGPADAIKLYNASNFFDAWAVPPDDDPAIADACRGFARVTVESHARLLGDRTARFAERLDGRLEIALGLETVHPSVFPRLNKGMSLGDFDEAITWCRDRDVGTRAFILVGLPWIPAAEFATWAVRSAEHARQVGVDRVSLIPLRTGNGALDDISRSGELEPVTLAQLEEAMSAALDSLSDSMIVEADTWDLERFSTCARCLPARAERLRVANLAQEMGPLTPCDCGA